MGERALPFMAVGRVQDGVTLAYFYAGAQNDEQEQQTKDIFQKLLGAASTKLAGGQRTRLQWNDGSVCCLMDEQGCLLYCLVTSLLAYPEWLAYQLLYDFRAAVLQISDLDKVKEHGLNEQLQPRMRELVTQYEDPKSFPSTPVPVDGARPGDKVVISSGNVLLRDPRTLKIAIAAGGGLAFVLLILIVKSMSG
mmetsp:Transcript_77093/g.238754  ORF Transcript_77093/g.238754 Transcript_77093/m.238754 type:complete len:194 (-) Transcript_77093:5-586(-)